MYPTHVRGNTHVPDAIRKTILLQEIWPIVGRIPSAESGGIEAIEITAVARWTAEVFQAWG